MTDAQEQTRGQIILGWWSHRIGDRDSSAARALAARLRRAVSPLEVLAEPQVHSLAQRLYLKDPVRLVRLAQTLAGVREHVGAPLPRKLGAGDTPAMSNLRFQRLIRSSDDELPAALRRALPMVERSCNVAALGQDLIDWNEEVRIRWCFHYFGAAAPQSSTPASVTDPVNEETQV